ncbi:MAG TPA: hypothetical protein VE913_06930, partial [Longimicrobium sp.]|nr:hypothetical protein [Longimicrobium sp.]
GKIAGIGSTPAAEDTRSPLDSGGADVRRRSPVAFSRHYPTLKLTTRHSEQLPDIQSDYPTSLSCTSAPAARYAPIRL